MLVAALPPEYTMVGFIAQFVCALLVSLVIMLCCSRGYRFRIRRTRVLGVIPARYGSTRFPGKPLVEIAGMPMILRTYYRASRSRRITRLLVATDDERIQQVCDAAGVEVIMTETALSNGTERCAQALQRVVGKYDVVVNIQGDEPLIDPVVIDNVIEALQTSPDVMYTTAVTSLKHDEAHMRNRVKCVVDLHGYAIYFSRGMIPFNKRGKVDEMFQYWLHLGLQCFDARFLEIYPRLPCTPCQLQEDLEQLKIIEHGYRIKVIKANHYSHGVDEPDDVPTVEALLSRT